MRYYVGSEARLRRAVEDAAMSVFDGWSYEEVITPTVDYYALFEHGMGQAEAQRGFRFSDNDGRMLALRPDVTSSVARAAATLLAERPRPLRLCYAASVFKQQQQSHAEWRRESTQLGCELIGAAAIAADLEMLAIAAEILSRLGLQESYCITINSVEIFNGIAAHLDLDEPSREQMRRLIDTRESAELQRFLTSYRTSAEERGLFARLTQLTGKREILNEARAVITNPRSVDALNALEALWSVIESTGLSFKVFVRGAGSRVGRGGRYDSLTANFGRAEPAVGFVLDLDALTEVVGREEFSLSGNNGREVNVLSGQDIAATLAAAQNKRENDERVRIEFGQ